MQHQYEKVEECLDCGCAGKDWLYDAQVCKKCLGKALENRASSGQAELTGYVDYAHEWECPECLQVGNYADIRRIFDSGVDSCPECRTPVICTDT